MPLREDLLQPIAGPNPAGADLRYDPLYDKLKEARREDDDAPQGEWTHVRKTADWPQVIKIASDALATKSKDLQLAAWMSEALLRRDGYAGFAEGLRAITGLLTQYWDSLYPEMEDGDAELRAAPLEWVGLKLDLAVRQVPLDKAGHNLLQYRESRTFPTEEQAAADEGKQQQRQRAADAGKLLPEAFDSSFAATPKAFYKALDADITATLDALKALDDAGRERFGPDAPSYAKLRGAIGEVQQTVRTLLARKLETDPDPVEVEAVPDTAAADGGAAAAPMGATAGGAAGGPLAPEPTSRDDAAGRIVSAARWLRRADARDPAPYLLLRGFRWGELRANGSSPDPRLLEAPPTHVRTQLKGLLLDQKWPQLLETAETVMGTPQGRGWLDLQRYALTACAALGSDYQFVTSAIVGQLRALLAELPGLIDMTLMDDTPTANRETRDWLRDHVLASAGDGGESADGMARLSAAAANGGTGGLADRLGGDAFGRAMSEVRAGRPQKGIELLMGELSREKSRRGRFLRQTQVASIMVDAGLHAVATPMLEELIAQVEAYKLEEWEAGEVVAQPMALLYRCIAARDDADPTAKQALYLRICRLDPLAAIGFGAQ